MYELNEKEKLKQTTEKKEKQEQNESIVDSDSGRECILMCLPWELDMKRFRREVVRREDFCCGSLDTPDALAVNCSCVGSGCSDDVALLPFLLNLLINFSP